MSNTGAVAAAATTFLAVFPAELPDKTMVATLVLTTRYRRPAAVWAGAAAAFTLQVALAVAAGRLISELPGRLVSAVVAVLFAVGAVVLWRSAGEPDDDEAGAGGDGAEAFGATAVAGRAFVVILLAEFGDLTQLTTASMAARTGAPVAVAIGALAALWTVAAIGVVAGEALQRRLPVRTVRKLSAGIFAVLALWSALEAIAG